MPFNYKRYQRCSFTQQQIRDNISHASYQEREKLLAAAQAGKEEYINTAIKLNSRHYDEHHNILLKIFRNEWPEYVLKYRARLQREGLISAVERMMECGNPEHGFAYYECPKCGRYELVTFTCKSRFCPKCGKKAREISTHHITRKLINVPHRQLVFSVPFDLRPFFRMHHDDMLNTLFSSVAQTMDSLLKHKAPKATRREKRKLGYIMFLHTYGRDLKWHPHIHLLVAERYMTKDNRLKKFSFFAYEFLRKTFLNILLHNMYLCLKELRYPNKKLQKFYKLTLRIKQKYPQGYYMYGPAMKDANTGDSKGDGKRLKTMRALTRYVARYSSHPAISQSRIISYDPLTHKVRWFYEPHEDDNKPESEKQGIVYVEDTAEDFISKLLIHIPTKGFKMVRYYGFYSQASKTKSQNLMFSKKDLEYQSLMLKYEAMTMITFGFDPIVCCCGTRMVFQKEKSFFPRGMDYGIP